MTSTPAGGAPRRAPGKAMLFGEYAVLASAPALVCAVDRYVTVTPTRDARRRSDSPFVREALAARGAHLAASHKSDPLPGLDIDSAPLYAAGAGGRKLGLGSSAAVVAAVFGPHEDLAPVELWRICQEAHSRAQGRRGSGADLAAAIAGGILRFTPAPDATSAPSIEPVALAPDLAVTLVDTGAAASTADRLAQLDLLRRHDPARASAVLDPLVALAREVAAAATSSGGIEFAAVQQWNEHLRRLESAIGMPILTPALDAVIDAAIAAGGAGKPSGAGGGDLAVLFTPRDATARLRAELARRGFAPLDVAIGARGLHASLEEPSS